MYDRYWHSMMARLGEELGWLSDVVYEEEIEMSEWMEKMDLSKKYPSGKMLNAFFRLAREVTSEDFIEILWELKNMFPIEWDTCMDYKTEEEN